jgi:hypothetical protein
MSYIDVKNNEKRIKRFDFIQTIVFDAK